MSMDKATHDKLHIERDSGGCLDSLAIVALIFGILCLFTFGISQCESRLARLEESRGELCSDDGDLLKPGTWNRIKCEPVEPQP